MIPSLIHRLISSERVEPAELEDALHEIMRGNVADAQTAGLLVALAANRVGPGMLAAGARVMREHRVAVSCNSRTVIDTCGTGGDGAGTFNISTAAAFVVAAAGAAVAKHGNRGVSSKVGSADVLEAAGCELVQTPGKAGELLDTVGFAFLFAPAFHPAMKHVAPVRRSLGIRTIFNLLGPLTNPALAESQLLGVYDPELTRVVATALRDLGSTSALVVHCAGLDEIGLHAVTKGHRLVDGRVEPFRLAPEDLGIGRSAVAELSGGDAATNLRLLRESLAGDAGARSDVVAVNAAAALAVCGVAGDLHQGLELARDLMGSGRAWSVFEEYAKASAGSQRASA